MKAIFFIFISMKKKIFLLSFLFSACTLLDVQQSQDTWFSPEYGTIPYTNTSIILLHPGSGIIPFSTLSNESFSLHSANTDIHPTNMAVSGSDICLYFPASIQPGSDYFLNIGTLSLDVVHEGQDLILKNSFDTMDDITNNLYGISLTAGPNLQLLPGKWGNGIDCGTNSDRTEAAGIPGNTIPMSDFTIEFWYTKTSEFVSNQIAALVYTSNPDVNFTNSMSVQIRSYWTMPGQPSRHVIMFGVRINTANDLLVNHYYDFGSLEALNAAFPLKTPVHIAVSKRNSDGRLRIFLNGNLVQGSYADFTYGQHFITPDTSVIANKTGYFPYETLIGHNNPVSADTPAGGIIDNFALYATSEKQFFLETP